MITSRERVLAALTHRTLDRIPICEDGIWPETIARWHSEGLPADQDPWRYFDLDSLARAGGIDTSFFPHEIYEDNPEYCVDLNGEGTVVKWWKDSTKARGHIELYHRVQTLADWRAAKPRLTVTRDRLRRAPTVPADQFRVLGAVDHFWMSFRMLGMENLCCWLVTEPAEMREIYADYTDFLLAMLDLALADGFEFDALWFFSDMAFHSGPMFSPRTFRDVVAPSYHRCREWCTRHGKWFFLHSDGNLNELMPEFLAVGFDLIQPLEARAGNDIRDLKATYGDRVTFMGNINADVLARGNRDEIEAEIAGKIPVAKQNGGYLYNIDHSVPPTVSFAAYSYAIERIRHYGRYAQDAGATTGR